MVTGGQGAKPPEAENHLASASGCATEAANLPHSVRTLTGLTPLLPRPPIETRRLCINLRSDL